MILEDRGIDAALSAVIARSPVPVVLDVQIAERPPAAVESAAYFVVTEALTNVARHSGATRANVSIARSADRLVVEIRDNGHGGADASKGTGLHGLRERVAGMGGTTLRDQSRGWPDHDPGGDAVRIVIAEDSVLLRAGLTRILADAGEDVVATVGDADELLRVVRLHQPDLAIVDVRMPPTHTDDGLRAALQIRSELPDIGILVLSQYVEEQYATELLGANMPGVGYLLKDRIADVGEFLGAVREVANGGTRARSRGGRPAARPQPPPRSARTADRPRARGARPDGGGTLEHRDRPAARGERQGGREARRQHLRQARPAADDR